MLSGLTLEREWGHSQGTIPALPIQISMRCLPAWSMNSVSHTIKQINYPTEELKLSDSSLSIDFIQILAPTERLYLSSVGSTSCLTHSTQKQLKTLHSMEQKLLSTLSGAGECRGMPARG